LRAIATLLLSCLLLACSSSRAHQQASSSLSASARLQAIPPADPSKFGAVRATSSWRNPYLIVSKNGISLLDVANSEERLLQPAELLTALAALPPSAWPYGRVVAVQESGIGGSDQDRAAIRKNRAVLAGTLEEAHIIVTWMPAT